MLDRATFGVCGVGSGTLSGVDIVFFAGPVVLSDAFKHIDWRGRDVRIVPVVGAGSDYFSALADSLRDSSGRMLPGLIARYAPGVVPDKVALAAFSAGHGLLNKLANNDADRAEIMALMLSDATFSGVSDPPKPGYVKFGVEAARGKKLCVSTTTHITPGTYLSGRDSWLKVWNAVAQQSGSIATKVAPAAPVPTPSGGFWRLGDSLYWGDYTQPGSAPNTGNDLTHEEHNYLAAALWQAYLAPWLAGGLGALGWVLAGTAIGTAVAFSVLR